MITKRLAIFKNIELGIESIFSEEMEQYLANYLVRITEYADYIFHELQLEEQIKNELALLDKMENEIKQKAMEGLINVEKRRGELLALTHESLHDTANNT